MDEHAGNLIVFEFVSLPEASRALAGRMAATAREAAERSGFFSVALSGGTTPRLLYELLATEFAGDIPWAKTVLFWGDERAVPRYDPASNYGLAAGTLLARLKIPESHIHPIDGTMRPIEDAAEAYERDLRQFFATAGQPEGETFDLVLLGLGPDGHTASLFPGSPVLREKERWVRASASPAAPPLRDRVTLTLQAINGAGKVFFLVSRKGKERALQAVFHPPEHRFQDPPALRVLARRETAWFIAAGD
jgi:6-phosphogluconolactonase